MAAQGKRPGVCESESEASRQLHSKVCEVVSVGVVVLLLEVLIGAELAEESE